VISEPTACRRHGARARYRDTETPVTAAASRSFPEGSPRRSGIKGVELEEIEQATLLHDHRKIGRARFDSAKPGPLTRRRVGEMRLHPEIGFRMLAKHSVPQSRRR